MGGIFTGGGEVNVTSASREQCSRLQQSLTFVSDSVRIRARVGCL